MVPTSDDDGNGPNPLGLERKCLTNNVFLLGSLVFVLYNLIGSFEMTYPNTTSPPLQRQLILRKDLFPNVVSPSNPTRLSPNMAKLWFASNADERKYEVPTDMEWIKKYGRGLDADGGVRYLTNRTWIETRGKQGNCAGALQVFNWIMKQVIEKNGCLMVAYGQLIHIHREEDFVNKLGKFIDDDIDLWASPETVAHVATLERQLNSKFGWTMRCFIHDGQVVLVQIVATCGHTSFRRGKSKSSQPGIEVYPMFTIPRQGNETQYDVIKDIWQGNQYLEQSIFPVKKVTLKSRGMEEPLDLQIPHHPFQLMECLYGNWMVPSSKHASNHMKVVC
mmetsp:Transcript_24446/g.39793  ORF Transcript_24446/g.39793 Transcript_24446/m.39793 type:complete len:334 (-) Transcript_24446:157-1158(-)